MELNNTIISIQVKCTVDESEARKVEELNNSINILQDKLSTVIGSINRWYNKTKISPVDIEDTYNKDLSMLNEYNTNLETSKSDFINLSKSLEDTTNNIRSIEAELELYQDDTNVEREYNESKARLDYIISNLNKNGVKPDINLINPLTNLLKVFSDTLVYIDSLYSDINTEDLVNICLEYNPNAVIEYQNELQTLFEEINDINSNLADVREKLKQATILSDRPKKCNIDNCPFIKEAILIDKEFGTKKLSESLISLQRDLQKASERVTKVNELIEISRNRDSKRSILDRIIDILDSNSVIIKQFGISILESKEIFLKMLSRQNSFNELRDPKLYKDILMILNLMNLNIEFMKNYQFNMKVIKIR